MQDQLIFFKTRLSKIEALLALKQRQINSLLEITEAVNHNWPIHALVRIYESILIAQLSIKKIALIIKDEEGQWFCISYTGANENFAATNYTDLVKRFQSLHFVSKIEESDFNEFHYIIPVAHKKEQIGFAFVGDFPSEDIDTLEEKLKFVQTITNIILVANENKRLFRNQLEQKVLEKELMMASDMQKMLVPNSLKLCSQIDAAAFYKPHKNVGGDYYDYFKLENGNYLFCMSDVSGKGAAAALLMSNFQANLHAISNSHSSLEKIITLLNKKIAQITNGEKYITLFLGIYHPDTHILNYVNAGHTPSILITDEGHRLLEEGCTILGMFDELPFIHLGEITLPKGSTLMNYTDGFSEATNASGEYFEIEGIIKFLKENKNKSVSEINQLLVEKTIQFMEGNDFDDDISLLTLKFY